MKKFSVLYLSAAVQPCEKSEWEAAHLVLLGNRTGVGIASLLYGSSPGVDYMGLGSNILCADSLGPVFSF